MAFFTLEDKTGEIECIAFPKAYNKFYAELRIDSAIFIVGQISLKDDEMPKIIVNDIEPLVENAQYKKRVATTPKAEVKAATPTPVPTAVENSSAPSKFSAYLSMYSGAGLSRSLHGGSQAG